MPTQVEAELKRQPAGGGALVSWELVLDALNTDTGRADPVIDYGAREKLDTVITRLTTIRDNTDQLETFVDGLEALLTTIRDNADTVEAKLQSVADNTDGIEGLLTTIRDNADGVEGLLTSIRDNVDNVESLLGALALEATVAHLKNKFARNLRTTKSGTASSVGDNDILTPASGKKIVLHWLGLFTSQDNSAENEVIAKFGAGGQSKYTVPMGNPGAFSHWEPIEGAIDEKFILNLENTQPVKWNVTYEEV